MIQKNSWLTLQKLTRSSLKMDVSIIIPNTIEDPIGIEELTHD